MANSCSNNIIVNGPEKDLLKFNKWFVRWIDKDSYLDMAPLLKIKPEEVSDKAGCKWFQPNIEFNEDSININGNSAWAPPLMLFTLISKKYPTLEFECDFEEMGNDFGGWAIIKDGVCPINEFSYWDYQFLRNKNDALEMIYSEIQYAIDEKEEMLENNLKDIVKKYLNETEFLEFMAKPIIRNV